ncbi:Neuroguidin EIF4E-binding protein [Pelomyxa schiedti]|nr:Neuroguidin EIF4E-binding protein [Pelomyxa schiedti]
MGDDERRGDDGCPTSGTSSVAGGLRVTLSEAEDVAQLQMVLQDLTKKINTEILPRCRLHSQKIGDYPTDKGVTFLELRHNMLLEYCRCLCFFILLKLHGENVENHPVIWRLATLRVTFDKIKILGKKLRYEIEKITKMALIGKSDSSDPLLLRPNPSNLTEGNSETTETSTNEIEEEKEKAKEKENEETADVEEKVALVASDGIYHPPKLHEVAYDTDRDAQRKRDAIERRNKKASRSGIMEYIRAEYGTMPEEEPVVGATRHDESESDEEQRQYEEDNMVRLNEKKTKKKKATNAFVDELAELDKLYSLNGVGEDDDTDEEENPLANYTQEKIDKAAERETRRKQARYEEDSDDGDLAAGVIEKDSEGIDEDLAGDAVVMRDNDEEGDTPRREKTVGKRPKFRNDDDEIDSDVADGDGTYYNEDSDDGDGNALGSGDDTPAPRRGLGHRGRGKGKATGTGTRTTPRRGGGGGGQRQQHRGSRGAPFKKRGRF